MVWPIETFCEKAVFNLFFLIFILGPDAKKHQKEEQHKIDNAEELTQDEQQEKEVLLYQGIFILLPNNFVQLRMSSTITWIVIFCPFYRFHRLEQT